MAEPPTCELDGCTDIRVAGDIYCPGHVITRFDQRGQGVIRCSACGRRYRDHTIVATCLTELELAVAIGNVTPSR